MEDIDGKYAQLSSDSDGLWPVITGRWFKVGAMVGGTCLMLLTIATASISNAMFRRTGTVQSTDLIGLPTISHVPFLGRQSGNFVQRPGPGMTQVLGKQGTILSARLPYTTRSKTSSSVVAAEGLARKRVVGMRLGVKDLQAATIFYSMIGMTSGSKELPTRGQKESIMSFGPLEDHAVLSLESGARGEKWRMDSSFQGLVFNLPGEEAVTAIKAAVAPGGGTVESPLAELEIVPSLVPDEGSRSSKLIRSKIMDPVGLPVTLYQKPRRDPFWGASIRVHYLDGAADFYAGVFGMQMLRYRSNLPHETSMSRFMGFNASDEGENGGFVLELKYVYGHVKKEMMHSDTMKAIVIGVDDVDAVAARAAKYIEENRDIVGERYPRKHIAYNKGSGSWHASVETIDGTLTIKDPDGHKIEVIPLPDPSEASQERIPMYDEKKWYFTDNKGEEDMNIDPTW